MFNKNVHFIDLMYNSILALYLLHYNNSYICICSLSIVFSVLVVNKSSYNVSKNISNIFYNLA